MLILFKEMPGLYEWAEHTEFPKVRLGCLEWEHNQIAGWCLILELASFEPAQLPLLFTQSEHFGSRNCKQQCCKEKMQFNLPSPRELKGIRLSAL